MKIGETVTASAWLTGKETPDLRAMWEARAVEAIDILCEQHGFLHGPVRYEALPPKSDRRVPEVPNHLSGPNVRLLVAEADITGIRLIDNRAFVGDLDPKDLQRLRQINYENAAKRGVFLTIAECDDIIEELGPEAALDTLRREYRTVH